MRISLKPKLRVGWSQVDRFDRLGPRRPRRPRPAGRRAVPRPGAPARRPAAPRRPRPPAHREIVAPPIRRPAACLGQRGNPLGELARARRRAVPRAPRRPAPWSAANTWPRRASSTASRAPPPAPRTAPPIPRASAASVPTGATGLPSAWASARAVATPIRSPVNEPGPTPTAIRSTRSQPPARSTSALELRQQLRWRAGAARRSRRASRRSSTESRRPGVDAPPRRRRSRCRSRRRASSLATRGIVANDHLAPSPPAWRSSTRRAIAVRRAARLGRRGPLDEGDRVGGQVVVEQARVLAAPGCRAGRGRGGRPAPRPR